MGLKSSVTFKWILHEDIDNIEIKEKLLKHFILKTNSHYLVVY